RAVEFAAADRPAPAAQAVGFFQHPIGLRHARVIFFDGLFLRANLAAKNLAVIERRLAAESVRLHMLVDDIAGAEHGSAVLALWDTGNRSLPATARESGLADRLREFRSLL